MTPRAYDPEFESILPLLPTVGDYSTLEKVRELRANRALMVPPPPDRDDVRKEDRRVPGPAGAPEVAIRTYRPTAPASANPSGCGRRTAVTSARSRAPAPKASSKPPISSVASRRISRAAPTAQSTSRGSSWSQAPFRARRRLARGHSRR